MSEAAGPPVPATETHPPGPTHAHGHDTPHFALGGVCTCTCPRCYDRDTPSLDGVCVCPGCPCTDSDHMAFWDALPADDIPE